MPTQDSDTPLYNIAAVVQRTGVPATTIRAWERRYAYPKPHRDEGGQRLYSERDVETIRWLLDQTTRGVAISRAVAMLRNGHATSDPGVVRTPPRSGRSFAALRDDLGQALLGTRVSSRLPKSTTHRRSCVRDCSGCCRRIRDDTTLRQWCSPPVLPTNGTRSAF
jgi:DNA-binding transcriptional MerR regulator